MFNILNFEIVKRLEVRIKVVSGFDQVPAMMINDKMYGNLTPPGIAEILKSYA